MIQNFQEQQNTRESSRRWAGALLWAGYAKEMTNIAMDSTKHIQDAILKFSFLANETIENAKHGNAVAKEKALNTSNEDRNKSIFPGVAVPILSKKNLHHTAYAKKHADALVIEKTANLFPSSTVFTPRGCDAWN